jgi:Skp family chaperone for outer membrane proteins
MNIRHYIETRWKWLLPAATIMVLAAVIGYKGMVSRPDLTDSVAFINFQVLLNDSQAGRGINAQVTSRRKELQKEAEAKLTEFQKLQDDIKRQRAAVSSAEFDTKAKELDQKVGEWNLQSQKREAEFNNAVANAVKVVQQVVREQAADVARDNRIKAVLSAEQAFYADRRLDITEEVIARLDEKLPKVEVQFEEKH